MESKSSISQTGSPPEGHTPDLTITPSVALKAIDTLNGKELKGAKMSVRRYYQRGNIGYSDASLRCLKERRRDTLLVDLIDS